MSKSFSKVGIISCSVVEMVQVHIQRIEKKVIIKWPPLAVFNPVYVKPNKCCLG